MLFYALKDSAQLSDQAARGLLVFPSISSISQQAAAVLALSIVTLLYLRRTSHRITTSYISHYSVSPAL